MAKLRLIGLLLLLFIPCLGNALLAQIPAKPLAVDYDIYNVNIQLDSYVIKPKYTPYQLRIDISYLPENANQSNLPVIYVTDGQWRRMDHKYIHYLTRKNLIPPVIVAGIGYTEADDAGQVRYTDLVIQPEQFRTELQNELIPLVEGKHRIDPKRRVLFGSSAGGHFVVYSFLQQALQSGSTFYGFIGGSPYLPKQSPVLPLANELTAHERTVANRLYLAYGAKESYRDFQAPNNQLFQILTASNLKRLDFWHHSYAAADHFDVTRLALIDGLRLLLGNATAPEIGAVDLKYRSYHYDFKTTTQFYDWQTNFSDQNALAPGPSPSGPETQCFKVAADFTRYSRLQFETSSVFFEGLADKDISLRVYIPPALAKLRYSLKFLIYSSFDLNWITDTSAAFPLRQSGWNTFHYKWRGQRIAGNIDCIRGFGVAIDKPDKAPAWKGDLYFDDVKW